jgi:2-hydroxy-3-oxopropionate reductase
MIGVIGVGSMGSGLVATLLRETYKVMVFDLDSEKVASVVSEGARAATDVAELVATCDPVFLSLPTSAVTVSVLEEAVLPHVRKGQTVIDAGTTIAEECRRLHASFARKGASFIDAPVSGGPGGASSGNLYIFVGGDKPAVDGQWPLLEKLGRAKLTYCGSSGSGQIVKAVNQLAMGLTQAALIETVSFGVNAGVDAGTLVDAVGGDGGFRGQFSQAAEKIANGDGDTMDAKYAEFKYFLHESKRAGFPMPILEHLYEWMSQFPESARDNMGRPFPPFWGSLTKSNEESE